MRDEEAAKLTEAVETADDNGKPPPPPPPPPRASRPKLALLCVLLLLLVGGFVWFLLSFQSVTAGGSGGGGAGKANPVIFTDLKQVHKRLRSKSDMPMYDFLRLHHQTGILRGTPQNVVSEVVRALNHYSAEEGLPLLVDLFSDLSFIWPAKLPEQRVEELRALQDEEEIRQALLELDLVDGNLQHAELSELKRILTRVLDVDGCIAPLKEIEKVRVLDFHASPYGRKARPNKKKTVEPPTEENLLHATQALNELEKYVEGRGGLNDILRSMLLDDLKEIDRDEEHVDKHGDKHGEKEEEKEKKEEEKEKKKEEKEKKEEEKRKRKEEREEKRQKEKEEKEKEAKEHSGEDDEEGADRGGS